MILSIHIPAGTNTTVEWLYERIRTVTTSRNDYITHMQAITGDSSTNWIDSVLDKQASIPSLAVLYEQYKRESDILNSILQASITVNSEINTSDTVFEKEIPEP